MKTLAIELRKEKRTGVIPVLLAVGVLGAAYAFVNFIVRKDTLLNLPLAPMDVLLTQLYGVIMVLNDSYGFTSGQLAAPQANAMAAADERCRCSMAALRHRCSTGIGTDVLQGTCPGLRTGYVHSIGTEPPVAGGWSHQLVRDFTQQGRSCQQRMW